MKQWHLKFLLWPCKCIRTDTVVNQHKPSLFKGENKQNNICHEPITSFNFFTVRHLFFKHLETKEYFFLTQHLKIFYKLIFFSNKYFSSLILSSKCSREHKLIHDDIMGNSIFFFCSHLWKRFFFPRRGAGHMRDTWLDHLIVFFFLGRKHWWNLF